MLLYGIQMILTEKNKEESNYNNIEISQSIIP
jgi:hypothetical protein